VPRYQTVGARQRLPGRAFTDPERTLDDIAVLDRMLARLRLQAQSWPGTRGRVELLEHTAGLRQWLMVPRPAALQAARGHRRGVLR